jgi:hypothetical protein
MQREMGKLIYMNDAPRNYNSRSFFTRDDYHDFIHATQLNCLTITWVIVEGVWSMASKIPVFLTNSFNIIET